MSNWFQLLQQDKRDRLIKETMSANKNYSTSIEQWSQQAYEAAKSKMKFKVGAGGKQDLVNFRCAFCVIMYLELGNYFSLTDCGKQMAKLENRKKPYSHCVLLHYIEKHRNAIEFPKANLRYMDIFNAVYLELNSKSLLKKFKYNANNN